MLTQTQEPYSEMKNILIITIINLISFILLISYSYVNVKECLAYWMHDASIHIKHDEILFFCVYSFLLPILLIFFQELINKKQKLFKIFICQYLFALFSILSLFVSIINPLEVKVVDNITYIFTSSIFTFSYYLFKLLNFIILSFIIYKIILSVFYYFSKPLKKTEFNDCK